MQRRRERGGNTSCGRCSTAAGTPLGVRARAVPPPALRLLLCSRGRSVIVVHAACENSNAVTALMTHLSELGSGFLLLHSAMSHQIVKHLSCKQTIRGRFIQSISHPKGGSQAAGSYFSPFLTSSSQSPVLHLPPLAYSITKYSVFSVSITSNNFTAAEKGPKGGRQME